MKKQECPFRSPVFRLPSAIKQLAPVPTDHRALNRFHFSTPPPPHATRPRLPPLHASRHNDAPRRLSAAPSTAAAIAALSATPGTRPPHNRGARPPLSP